MIPNVLWAQRNDLVYLTIEVFEVRDEKVELTDNQVIFTGIRSSDDAKFAVSLELYGAIDVEKSKIRVSHRDVALVLAKAEAGPYWPRLLKTTQKMHYVHTDFSKWKDEDEGQSDEERGAAGFGNQFGNFDMSQFSNMGGEAGAFDEEEDYNMPEEMSGSDNDLQEEDNAKEETEEAAGEN